MKLGLLNTLTDGRGGGISGDGLALDLQFALDKTLTARKGPTPTFTRASSGTFVGSNGLIQTAATNIPRFDHTSAGVCRGLLIEESRTNNLRQSQDLSNTTTWTLVNTTNTQSAVGPDGVTNSASVLNEGTATGDHSTYGAFGQNRPVMGAVSCSLSVFISAGTRRYVMINASDFANGAGIVIDTQNWTITDAKSVGTGWTYTSSRLTNVSGGWYRAELVFTPPSAASVIPRIQGTLNPTFSSFATGYTGTSSTIIVYGIQLEAGPFHTSYIPTTTGSVVRSADVCSITGANFTSFYNPIEGTSYSACSRIANSGDQRTLVYTNGTSGNRLEVVRASSTNRENVSVYSSGSFAFDLNLGTNIAAGSIVKIANAMKSNDWAASINGAAAATNATTSIMLADRLIIGSSFLGSSGFLNGYIAAIRYYRKRLPNAKLQALTA